MTSNRVYVGRVPYSVHEKDIEKFFRGIGRIRDIMLKNGYCFVEFDDHRDAADAVYECNGQFLLGERVSVESAKGTPHGEDLKKDEQRGIQYPPQRRRDFDRPRGDYRLLVENLSTRISWQDLKEMMRKAGDVAFADAHRERRNEGIVEFVSQSGIERAIDKFDGVELNGRKIKLIDISPKIKKRSLNSSRGRKATSSGSSSSSDGGSDDDKWRSKRKRRKSQSDDSEGAYDSDVEKKQISNKNGHDARIQENKQKEDEKEEDKEDRISESRRDKLNVREEGENDDDSDGESGDDGGGDGGESKDNDNKISKEEE